MFYAANPDKYRCGYKPASHALRLGVKMTTGRSRKQRGQDVTHPHHHLPTSYGYGLLAAQESRQLAYGIAVVRQGACVLSRSHGRTLHRGIIAGSRSGGIGAEKYSL